MLISILRLQRWLDDEGSFIYIKKLAVMWFEWMTRFKVADILVLAGADTNVPLKLMVPLRSNLPLI